MLCDNPLLVIWRVLEQLFQSQSRSRVLQLKKMLYSQKKGALSVDDYFLRMCSYADQVNAIGHVIDDEELGDFILAGFGAEYESAMVNFLHRAEVPNMQEMQYALQCQEICLQQSVYSFAFRFDGSFVQRGGRAFRGCGGASSSYSSHFKYSGKSLIVCQLYGRTNHVAPKCYKRFDVNFTGVEINLKILIRKLI